DLPHHLIASFKATLEEARQARLLLHVVDASNPGAEEQIKAVNAVLKELGCSDKPTLLVLNKVDQVRDLSYLHVLQKHHRRSVSISAVTGKGLDELRAAVIEMLSADFTNTEIDVAAANGRVLAYLAAHAEIYRQEFTDSRVKVRCYLPRFLFRHIQEPDVHVRLLEAAWMGMVWASRIRSLPSRQMNDGVIGGVTECRAGALVKQWLKSILSRIADG